MRKYNYQWQRPDNIICEVFSLGDFDKQTNNIMQLGKKLSKEHGNLFDKDIEEGSAIAKQWDAFIKRITDRAKTIAEEEPQ